MYLVNSYSFETCSHSGLHRIGLCTGKLTQKRQAHAHVDQGW